jgi:phosphoribosylamine--glycine ligase
MERIGILVVSYGSRDVAIIDTLSKSEIYDIEFYIADKQRNPFNLKITEKNGEHIVIPDLSIQKICNFATKYKDKIRFGIVGSETPIINGIRDIIEKETKIPIICPTKKYAIESSKVSQRILLQKSCPQANPLFKIFDPNQMGQLPKNEFKDWVLELGGVKNVVIKPDRPGFGKGVGVGEEHFGTFEEAYTHFNSIYGRGGDEKVIVEQKINGEESSFQAFCDGKHLAILPDTRDHKRAFDGDKGPNTGGMGSYKGQDELLPFMLPSDRDKEIEIVNEIFHEISGGKSNTNLLGIPFYVAFMHSSEGPKILEINSRPGDPEIQSILPIIDEDLVDVFLKILDGELHSVKLKKMSSVVIYKVPPSYARYMELFSKKVMMNEINSPVYFSDFSKIPSIDAEKVSLYPGSIELREDGNYYSLKSRTICSVGIGDTIEDARNHSLLGIENIHGGALWFRKDIASKEHINKCVDHMIQLRKK